MRSRWLLVDDREELIEPTRRRLERLYPGLTVAGFTSGAAALADIEDPRIAAPEVLITDLRMSPMGGLELLLTARAILPQLPVVLVTAYSSLELAAELRRISGIEILEKPFEIETLVGAVERSQAAMQGLSGNIVQAEFSDLVQMFVFGQASGRLEIRQNDKRGEIWFERGRIVHAECRGYQGNSAFFEIMTWKSGRFALSRGEGQAPGSNVDLGWQHLLLEGARLMDDPRAEEDEPFDIDLLLPGADSVEPVAPTPPSAGPSRVIEESLLFLGLLDGFLGACCVDAGSGTVLGSRGGGSFDLETAALGDGKVLKTQLDTIESLGAEDRVEDILITLADQHHLIRPLDVDGNLYIFLVLDKSQANLALARHKLAVAEVNLSL